MDRVPVYKLLGVYISNDLRWNYHIEFIFKKASKRPFSLRLSRRAGVPSKLIRLKDYLTTVRSILEYGAQVWKDIPAFLSDKLESVQRRALSIKYPSLSYADALSSVQTTWSQVIVIAGNEVLTRGSQRPLFSPCS